MNLRLAAANALLTLLATTPLAAQGTSGREVSRIFAEQCASCHGKTLSGGQAQSLLDDTWRFGGDEESLARSIRAGNAETGMPAVGHGLNEDDIRAMVIFIREQRARPSARRPPTPGPDRTTITSEREPTGSRPSPPVLPHPGASPSCPTAARS